jgi:hypothetical protein
MTTMTLTPEILNNMSHSQNEQMVQMLNKIVTKCWQDNSFKESLTSDPISVCKENGLIIEGFNNVEVADREGSKGELILRIPTKPSTAELEAIELPEEELEKQAGGQKISTPVCATIMSVLSLITIIKETMSSFRVEEDDWRGGKKKGG